MWTSETPTEPGYYWIRFERVRVINVITFTGPMAREISIVYLNEHGHGWEIMAWDAGWRPEWNPGVEFCRIDPPE